jgi:pSer/pThr/pTyr-binding forkhead associated (FHA) protein
MTRQSPELIFVAGPQAGLRHAMMSSPVIIGRDPEADVLIEDESVSRKHARFDLTSAGWVLTNLSRNGTLVNDKRYRKSSKQIILDTGDVMTLGQETVILYVAPGDDGEAALAAWREANLTDQAPQVQEDEQEAEPEDSPDRHVEEPEQKGPPPRPAPENEQDEEEDQDQPSPSGKFKKVAIGLGIYLLAMVGLFIYLAARQDSSDANGDSGPPSALARDEIRRILDKQYDVEEDPIRARTMLERAEQFYRRRNDAPGNLYRAVKAFKLHLEHKGSASFAESRHLQMYLAALDQLTDKVVRLYDQAYKLTRRQRWREALAAWKRLQAELPVKEPPHIEAGNQLWDHITDQISYVARKHQESLGESAQ